MWIGRPQLLPKIFKIELRPIWWAAGTEQPSPTSSLDACEVGFCFFLCLLISPFYTRLPHCAVCSVLWSIQHVFLCVSLGLGGHYHMCSVSGSVRVFGVLCVICSVLCVARPAAGGEPASGVETTCAAALAPTVAVSLPITHQHSSPLETQINMTSISE